MNTDILPLAITMMAGPQIMSAIIFVTLQRAVRMSLAFIVGAAIGVTAGLIVTTNVASLLDLGDPDDSGSLGNIIQYVLVAGLIGAAIRNAVKRTEIEPPKWLGALMEADEKKAFALGVLLLSIFPSDAVVLFTVGTNLEHHGDSVGDALPFIGLVVLIAALPLAAFLLFHRRAVEFMPKVRDWMNASSWIINIIVCLIFLALILA